MLENFHWGFHPEVEGDNVMIGSVVVAGKVKRLCGFDEEPRSATWRSGVSPNPDIYEISLICMYTRTSDSCPSVKSVYGLKVVSDIF